MVGVAVAVIPFKEEMVVTDYMVEISDWDVSWYFLVT